MGVAQERPVRFPRWGKGVALLLLTGALLWGALRGVQAREMGATLQHARPAYLGLGALLGTGAYLLRALRSF